jgi:replicative DNA helicase
MLTNQEVEIEQEILGGLFNNNDLLIKAKETIKANMFKVAEHRAIYKAFTEMKADGYNIDLLNFLEHNKDKTKNFGGVAYVGNVTGASPSDANFESKLKILVENYKRHTIKDLIPKIADTSDLAELTSNLETTLKTVYESDTAKKVDLESNYENYLNWIYEDKQNIGYKSGLKPLDEVLGNFQPKRLITIFARASVGKSTVAIQIALNMALQEHRVVYASGEMSELEVLGKMASSKLKIPYKKIINKKLNEDEKLKIAELTTTLLNNKFYITNETNINKLISEIKSYKLQNGLDVVFIDYVNKYTNGIDGHSLSEKIGVVTYALKDLALKENICVVLLAQCNRLADKNNNADYVSDKITEADIQDSARIEQDSDQLIALYRNKKLDDEVTKNSLHQQGKLNYLSMDASINPHCINFVICKNRHGERKTLAFSWDGKYSNVSNWTYTN